MIRKATPVRAILEHSSGLIARVQDGIQAVRQTQRQHFEKAIRMTFSDSLDLDEALRKDHETEFRWDYLLGHEPSREVVAVEPHSAKEDQITTVIRKREAARLQLQAHLRSGARIAKWLWVASGRVDFADTEKARYRLDQSGIEFVGTRVAAKHLPPPLPPATAHPATKTRRARKS